MPVLPSESREIKMGAAKFAVEMLFRYGWFWLICLSAIAICGIVFGIVIDLRILFVGLMFVFIIIPLVLVFLYYYYGLSQEAIINTSPHTFIIDNSGIVAKLVFRSEPDIPLKSDNFNERENAEDKDSSEQVLFNTREVFFAYENMDYPRFGLNSLIIPFILPSKGFIWIPFDSFETVEKTTDILNFINEQITGYRSNDQPTNNK